MRTTVLCLLVLCASTLTYAQQAKVVVHCHGTIPYDMLVRTVNKASGGWYDHYISATFAINWDSVFVVDASSATINFGDTRLHESTVFGLTCSVDSNDKLLKDFALSGPSSNNTQASNAWARIDGEIGYRDSSKNITVTDSLYVLHCNMTWGYFSFDQQQTTTGQGSIEDSVGVKLHITMQSITASVFLNPSRDRGKLVRLSSRLLGVAASERERTLKVFDILGKECALIRVPAGQSRIQLPALTKGTYIVNMDSVYAPLLAQ